MIHDEYKVDVPEGEIGDFRIEKFTVSKIESMASMFRASLASNMSRGFVPSGTYTRMLQSGRLWMSDTPDEIHDHLELFEVANGSVLINGLGLGMAARGVLLEEEVQDLTVIEISEEVIQLVQPWLEAKYAKGRLKVIHGDAFEVEVEDRYDVVWHDIWDDIGGKHLDSIDSMEARFEGKCGWQQSWCKELMLYRNEWEKEEVKRLVRRAHGRSEISDKAGLEEYLNREFGFGIKDLLEDG
jgi:hypothetical protein